MLRIANNGQINGRPHRPNIIPDEGFVSFDFSKRFRIPFLGIGHGQTKAIQLVILDHCRAVLVGISTLDGLPVDPAAPIQ